MRTISIILLTCFVLSGCGRKGALFMPPHTADQQVASEQPEQNEQP